MRGIKKHQHHWFFTFHINKNLQRWICKHCDAIKYTNSGGEDDKNL